MEALAAAHGHSSAAGMAPTCCSCDAAADIRMAIDGLAKERIYCRSWPTASIVRPSWRGSGHPGRRASEFLPLPPEAELIAAILAAVGEDQHELISRDPAWPRPAVPTRSRRPRPAS